MPRLLNRRRWLTAAILAPASSALAPLSSTLAQPPPVNGVIVGAALPIDAPSAGVVPPPVIEIDDRKVNKVRLAYVFSFLRFVSWPASTRDEFHIAVVGNPQLGRMLTAVSRRKPFKDRQTGQTKPIRVDVAATLPTSPPDLLLVGGDWQPDADAGASSLEQPSPTFVIDDSIGSARSPIESATARFAIRDGTLKFDLRLAQSRHRGLELDAKLMKAADQILDP